MLTYVPTDRANIADRDWLWIEAPDGERFLLLDKGKPEIGLPDAVVEVLARQVEWRRMLDEGCGEAS